MTNSRLSEKSFLFGHYPVNSYLLLETEQYPVTLALSLHVVFHLSPQIGTNQIAVCAKAQNKPFYVVAESFKFVRLFPLNQQDVPDKFKVREIQIISQLRCTLRYQ